MLKKMITYTDYAGNERTEPYYFNLNKAEIQEMNLRVTGGYKALLERMVAKEDLPGLVDAVKKIILDAYGEKSADDRRFVKSAEMREAFEQSEAYSELFCELLGDADAAAAFMNGIIPQVPSNEPLALTKPASN